MKTLGVIANGSKPRAPEVLARLNALAEEYDLALYCEQEHADALPHATPLELDAMLEAVEGLVVLGGDGSMLAAVRALDGHDVPVIGVNVGSLGFLTSVAEDELEAAVKCLATDSYGSSTRRLMRCRVMRDNEPAWEHMALNDVVIQSSSSRVVSLAVAIDGEPVNVFICDGLICATPTGSTGYSLSASGPIVHPSTEALVVTVICPHTLSSRPLVVPVTSTIAVSVEKCSSTIIATADGQVEYPLSDGETVEVAMHGDPVRFLHLPGYSYYGVLQKKLGWNGTPGLR